jgi:hypothetical protein
MYAQPMNEDTRNGLALLGYISERHRERLHLENYELRRIRNNVRDYMDDAWRRELCIKRLASEISEAEWRIALQRAGTHNLLEPIPASANCVPTRTPSPIPASANMCPRAHPALFLRFRAYALAQSLFVSPVFVALFVAHKSFFSFHHC